MPKPAAIDIAYNRIETWILSGGRDSELPKHYRDIFERWRKVDDLLDKYPKQKDAIAIYKEKFPDLSTSQIYYDFANARRFFNNYNAHDKERIRNWLINDILQQIEVYKTWEEKGFKAVNTAHANLIKAAQLDVKEEESIDPEILEQHNFYTIINIGGKQVKADFRRFQELPETTRKKLSDYINAMPLTEDAAFEILNPHVK